MRINITVIFAFFVLQLLDIITTYTAITYFAFTEANPVAKLLFNILGMESVLILKIIFVIGLVLGYKYFHDKKHRLGKSFEFSLKAGSIFSFWAVVINITGLVKVISI